MGTGGLENGLVNLINRSPMDKYRHAIICLTESGEFEQRITIPGVQVFALNKREGHDLRVYGRLWKTLRSLQPAIVHTRNLAALEMQVISFLACRAMRVHGEHGRDVHDLDGSNRKYQLLRRILCPFLHCIITVSRDLESWLVSVVGIPADKVRQIYNGVDAECFHPRRRGVDTVAPHGFLPGEGFVVGTVGRLADVKDQRTLVRAFAKLRQIAGSDGHRCRLIIVGSGPRYDDLRREVEDLDLGDSVWLTGDRTDVPELLRLMDIFVLPSLGEGISNTLLEAMATGLPVIATRVGGNPELVDDGVNGKLVPVSSPQCMAEALYELLRSPEKIAALGCRSREKVDSGFSWRVAVDNYISLYDRLLATGQRVGA